MTWYVIFFGLEAKNYNLGICFANNVIHLWPQVMPLFDQGMPPGFTPAIFLCHNFVYISTLENQGDKSWVVGHADIDQGFCPPHIASPWSEATGDEASPVSFKFRLSFQVTAERSIGFWSHSGDIDQLFVLRSLR